MRRWRAGVVVALAAVAAFVTGCVLEPGPGYASGHASPSARASEHGAGPTPTPIPYSSPPPQNSSAVTAVAAPVPLNASTIDALRPERIRNDDLGLQARWVVLPGSGATADFNARIERAVRDGIGERASATGRAYHPAVFPRGAGLGDRTCVPGATALPGAEVLRDPRFGPANGAGTAIVCDVVAAQGPMFGERMRVVQGAGDRVAGDRQSTLYVDVTTGEVADASALWTDAAPLALYDDIVDALGGRDGALVLRTLPPPDAATLDAVRIALADTVPAPDGSLIIALPAGFALPERPNLTLGVQQPRYVAVAPTIANSLTTPFARALMAAAGEPFAPPARDASGFEQIDCALLPCVALTYDDGPSELTPGILDTVRDHHASVSFFAMGEKAGPYGDTMRRALAEGNLVENHTWDHPHLPDIPLAKAKAEIADTQVAIAAATGQTPTIFRPPYGDITPKVLGVAGMAAMLWNVDTLDWQHPDPDTLVARAVDQPAPQSIVLQHDIQQVTADTVSRVYDGLADRGFTIVNLRQLFGGTLPTSGAWRHGP